MGSLHFPCHFIGEHPQSLCFTNPADWLFSRRWPIEIPVKQPASAVSTAIGLHVAKNTCHLASIPGGPFDTQKVLRTVFGIRALFSAQIQFEHFLRLPSRFEKCSRAQLERNVPLFGCNVPELGRNSKKCAKPKLCPQSVCLHVFAFTIPLALFATTARANICVSMGPAGKLYIWRA